MKVNLQQGATYLTNEGVLLKIQTIDAHAIIIEYVGEARELRQRENRPNPVTVDRGRVEEFAEQQKWKRVATPVEVTWPDSQ